MFRPSVRRESVNPNWKSFAYAYAPYQGLSGSQTPLIVGGLALIGGVVGLAYWQDYKQKKADADAADIQSQREFNIAVANGEKAKQKAIDAQNAGDPAAIAQAEADRGAAEEAKGRAILLKAQADYKAKQAEIAAQAISTQAAQKGLSLTRSQIDATTSGMGVPTWVWIAGAGVIILGGLFWFKGGGVGTSTRRLRRAA